MIRCELDFRNPTKALPGDEHSLSTHRWCANDDLREESVDFEEGGAGGVGGAADDGGVGAWEDGEDGGFVIIGGSEGRIVDLLLGRSASCRWGR